MSPAAMDTVTAVAIGILAAVFVGSLIALIVVLKHKYCKKMDLISRQMEDSQPDVNLVENMEGPLEHPSGFELDHVNFSPSLEEILNNEDWVNDATGLAPHTLAILKTCHQLTEKLVAMTMSSVQQARHPEVLTDLVAIAKRIGPRVDDIVSAMYPPLDPRLLEARCSALVLQVSQLVLVTKSACRLSGVLDWVDQSLADIEDNLKILRDASSAYENSIRQTQVQADNISVTGGNQAANHCGASAQPHSESSEV